MKMRRIRYRRIRVRVPETRTGVCSGCDKATKTDSHHWKLAYPTKKVKENPLLALENTSEVGFRCHRIANALKLIADELKKNPKKMQNIIDTMPLDMELTIEFFGMDKCIRCRITYSPWTWKGADGIACNSLVCKKCWKEMLELRKLK